METIQYAVQMSSCKADDIISYDTVEVPFMLTIRETIERFEFDYDRGRFTVTQFNRSDNEMTSYLTFELTEFLSPQSNVQEKKTKDVQTCPTRSTISRNSKLRHWKMYTRIWWSSHRLRG
ncbi:hypothetical protein QJS10_CPB19g01865 [Acorus calamus]|uniref:Uncharacterized protein n=1 Tax=Acorus calamus TaxID=4465 RepID=A0AAV9CI38_ACOCL|nr:hypothetical protein QJS10_CPB19g01865 [Acorus calamus]